MQKPPANFKPLVPQQNYITRTTVYFGSWAMHPHHHDHKAVWVINTDKMPLELALAKTGTVAWKYLVTIHNNVIDYGIAAVAIPQSVMIEMNELLGKGITKSLLL